MDYKNTIEIKLSYLEYRLSLLPKGWISIYRGRQVVYVTSDPYDETITSYNKRRFYTNTDKGIFYKNLIEEYLKLESEYKELRRLWYSTFSVDPIKIEYPLNQRLSGISSDYFRSAVPNQNELRVKNPISYNGQILRSKNELIAVQNIENMGFEWKSEVKLQVRNHIFYPDVVFDIPFLYKSVALEVDGMMDEESYSKKSDKRLNKYLRAGFTEFTDVLFVRSINYFDTQVFRRLIEISIELNSAELIHKILHA